MCFDFERGDDPDALRAALDRMDEEVGEQLHINMTERLLAEGDIQVEGQMQRVARRCLTSFCGTRAACGADSRAGGT